VVVVVVALMVVVIVLALVEVVIVEVGAEVGTAVLGNWISLALQA